ncbi:hypothetical protein [Pseudomonas sp. GM79]|uniref:hypothetical protein n=1 Tax=Pseudomonas sp. GM79 TaxID=1144338 RepID=UPI001EE65266|nr:hypothetical protein [Pseudomonas sp. GM79]
MSENNAGISMLSLDERLKSLEKEAGIGEGAHVITPFEAGTLAALTAIGVSLGAVGFDKRNKMIDLIGVLKSKLPENPKFKGADSIYHAPLEALLTGLSPIPSERSAD